MPDPNITEVYLLNVPLENDYRHTIWFPDQTAQESYFKGKVKQSYTDFSYQRKDGYIRVPAGYDSVVSMGCNYVMYRNKAYSNKWFYAFITNIEYKDDGRTDIHIETDVMQTWMFNYTVKASYIEREHCFDDTAGANTQPEDLETGEYLTTGVVDTSKLIGSDYKIIIGSTVDATQSSSVNDEGVEVYPSIDSCQYGGVFSGVRFFVMDNPSKASLFLRRVERTGQADAVNCVFMFPASLIDLDGDGNEALSSYVTKTLYTGDEVSINAPTKMHESYKPKNNKLLTYPYCYLMATNNAGAETIYRYEFFDYSDDAKSINFRIDGVITPSGSIRLTPLKYAGENENYLRGLTGAKLPIGSWNSDVYTNWLTQQAMNLQIAHEQAQIGVKQADLSQTKGVVDGIFGVLGHAISGSLGGALTTTKDAVFNWAGSELNKESAFLNMKSVAAQKYTHSMVPPESKGNLNCGDVNYAMGLCNFTFRHMSIRSEYARIIDKFFDMYGYATNLVKEPYKNHRESYWFTKTIAVNVDGAIPNADLNIIKRCYNNGITFWRHTTTVGDYTQSNNIV